MLNWGSDTAVPVVTVSDALLAFTFARPVTVPPIEVSVTLASPMVMPVVPPSTPTAKLPLLVKARSPPEKPAATVPIVLPVLVSVASPVPMRRKDGALIAPDWVIAPAAETVSRPPAAMVEAAKLMGPSAVIAAFAADTMPTVPNVEVELVFRLMGFPAPAVSVVVPGTVQAPPWTMPAEFDSVTTASCAVMVNAPS